MQTSCSEDLPQPPPGTFFILVSYVSLYRSHSTTLAVPHKYAAVEIPASQSHRKTAKSTLVLFENGEKMAKSWPWDLHPELSTEKVAQHSEIGSVPQTQTEGGNQKHHLKVGQESIKSSLRPQSPPCMSLPASTSKTALESVGALQSQSHKLWPR